MIKYYSPALIVRGFLPASSEISLLTMYIVHKLRVIFVPAPPTPRFLLYSRGIITKPLTIRHGRNAVRGPSSTIEQD